MDDILKKIRSGVSLKDYTTFKVGGPASYFVELDDVKDLGTLYSFVKENELPVLFLGRGSNLLIADEGFKGLVIKLGKEFQRRKINEDKICFGASYFLPTASKDALRQSLTGLEWGIGVPGSVGGALRTNAGCCGQETSDTFHSLKGFDFATGQYKELSSQDIAFSYRHSNLPESLLVTQVTHQLKRGNQIDIKKKMDENLNYRRSTQPKIKNAGSVFINPPGDYAGRLIESLGLKGYSYKSARISPIHANFIESTANGQARDIYDLIKIVQEKVFNTYGIKLECEIRLYGFKGDRH